MEADRDKDAENTPRRDDSATDPTLELTKLMELATRHREIGPPLAELAFKIGQPELGNRIVRMGLEGDSPGLEFYFVAANVARREGRAAEVPPLAIEALRAYAAAPAEALAPDDASRVLHLVRLGFATLLFDIKDPAADATFVQALEEELPRHEEQLGADPFYRSLLAQARWYGDREQSEREWDRAVELGDPELAWNARGTWYKEAERDLDKAEQAYRRGLEKADASALLHHNLAQVLIEKSEAPETDGELKRRLLREADTLLRAALRAEAPKGLRRHIHSTRDRLTTLRAGLPPRGRTAEEPAEPERLPEVNEVVRGRVVSLTAYGAFVSLGGRNVGLLHKTELAHEHVADPASLLKVGDEVEVKVTEVQPQEGANRPRISLSRKALLPAPPGLQQAAAQQAQRSGGERGRGDRPRGDRPRGDRPRGDRDRGDRRPPPRHDRRDDRPEGRRHDSERQAKIASLGEMLLAKMEQQKK